MDKLNIPIQIQKTHLDLCKIVIDMEHKKITLEGKIGTIDADGNLKKSNIVHTMSRDIPNNDEFTQAINVLLPTDTSTNVRQTVRQGAMKILKKYLEKYYNLPDDSL